jgi:hypothetical protein
MGVNCERPGNIIDSDLGMGEFEIRADIINELVFRKRHLPPDILIETTYHKFANGLSRNRVVSKYAQEKINMYRAIGTWTN